jgi:serine/threonine protein kinase
MAGLEGAWLGKFHVIRRIGGGGMGDVYLAEQPELRRQVAIKVLHGASMARSQEEQRQTLQQLMIEVRAVATLQHPNIIPMYDFGEQHGILYFVMEYVPFGSIADFLAVAPLRRYSLPLPLSLVADLIEQVATALQFAHDHQFVHLDVKPQNLLLKIQPLTNLSPTASGALPQGAFPAGEVPVHLHVILADFGLARFITSASVQSGASGTPLYTAPEQYLGHRTPSIDQYALAGVAYLLLTGDPVFHGTLPELYHQHMSVVPRLATSVNPQLPPALNEVLAQALAKDPAQRFPRIQAFAQALKQAVGTPEQGPVYSLPTTVFGIAPQAVQSALPADLQAQPGRTSQPVMPPPQAQSWGLLGGASPSVPPAAPPPSQMNAAASQPLAAPSFPAQPGPGGAASPAGVSFPSQPPGQPFGGVLSASSQPLSVPKYREADAPPAPIPPSAQSAQRLSFLRRLPLWQQILLGSLALLLVLGAVATALLVLRRPAAVSTTNPIQVTSQTLTRFAGQQTVSALPALTQPPQAQAQIAVRLRTPTQPAAPTTNSHLPVIPINTAARDATTSYQATLPAPKKGDPSDGLGQQLLGTAQPVDVAIASTGTYTVELVNGGMMLLTNGTARRVSLADFFKQPLGKSANLLGEPRIVFAEGLAAWVMVVNQFNVTDGGSITGSFFDLAISESADPSGKWDLYQISTQLAAYSGCTWADNPQIGSNGLGLFLTGTSFACGKNGALLGAALWELPKATLAASQNANTVSVVTGFTTSQGRPVVTLTPAQEGAQDQTAWLLSNDAGYVDGGQVSTQLSIWAVIPGNQTNQSASPVVIKGAVTLPYAYADPPLAPQMGASALLNTGDARITQAQFIGGHLYGAFTTAISWQNDTPSRAAIYWIDVQPTLISSPNPADSTARGHLVQAGLLGDPESYFFSPVFVADAFGNAVLLGEASGAKLPLHAIFTSRLPNDPFGSLGGGANNLLSLPVDATPYSGTHWGDYAGGSAVTPANGAKNTSIVLAGPYVSSSPAGWKTAIWKIPTKET